MSQPFGLTFRLASYLAGRKLAGVTKYPIVMMLEPLHTCNLACLGCTPDRWDGPKKDWMTLDQVFESVDECDAPIVSICGGEPLIHTDIEAMVKGVVARKKYAIVCTNALLLEKKLPLFDASPFLSFAVHIDGLEKTHDHITKYPGCFKKAVAAAKAAKAKGIRVTTNTTVFKESDPDEMVELFTYLKEDVGVDAILVSPGYDFDQTGADYFLKRREVHERFKYILSRCKPSWFGNSSLYLEFLQGEVELTCTAWGNPTRTPKGWQGPCYMLRDGYYRSYHEMLEKVDWTKYGPESEDNRCKSCMVHCGFEPTVATGRGVTLGAQMRTAYRALV